MTETLSPEERADLKAKALKATPGPWDTILGTVNNWHDGTYELEVQAYVRDDAFNHQRDADLAFIAAANPTAVLALLGNLEAAKIALANKTASYDDAMKKWSEDVAEFSPYKARADKAEADLDVANGAIQACRDACKSIMGGNATFVDDDVARALLSIKERAEKAEQQVSVDRNTFGHIRRHARYPASGTLYDARTRLDHITKLVDAALPPVTQEGK